MTDFEIVQACFKRVMPIKNARDNAELTVVQDTFREDERGVYVIVRLIIWEAGEPRTVSDIKEREVLLLPELYLGDPRLKNFFEAWRSFVQSWLDEGEPEVQVPGDFFPDQDILFDPLRTRAESVEALEAAFEEAPPEKLPALDEEAPPNEPRNSVMEDAITEAPEDVSNYAVYADWLSQQGAPRGELISLMIAAEDGDRALRREAWQRLHELGPELLGPLKVYEYAIRFSWRRGFLERVDFEQNSWRDESTMSRAYFPSALSMLMKLPDWPFIRALRFADMGLWGPVDSNWELLERLVKLGHPGLESLEMRVNGQPRSSISPLSLIGEALPKLKRLHLRGTELCLETALPSGLRTLDIDRRSATQIADLEVAAPAELERLVIKFEYGTEDKELVEALSRLLARRLVALRELVFGECYFGDALVEMLSKHPALTRLKSLDLSRCKISEAGAKHLASCAERFSHLASLKLPDAQKPSI